MAEIATTYADAVVSICETPTSDRSTNAAGFEGMTFVSIANVVTVPAFSVTEEMQTRQYVDQLGIHLKGAKIGAATEIAVGRDTSDDGYNALVAASKTSAWYPMKIELADSPNPGGATGDTTNTVEYALVLIGRGALPGGGANDDIIETYPLMVQSDPVIVPPETIV